MVLDLDSSVEECEQENLIVTSFTNAGSPSMRYNTSDIGAVKIEGDGAFIYDLAVRMQDTLDINGELYATHFILNYLDHKYEKINI